MNLYRISIEPGAPFITPLDSDTLFGHIAWAIIYTDGESKLQQLLSMFSAGDPPFLLSSAFPEGKLPVPVLPPLSPVDMAAIFKENKVLKIAENALSLRMKLKHLRKTAHMSLAGLTSISGGLNPLNLCIALLKETGGDHIAPAKEVVYRTAINRASGGAETGSLHSTEQTFFPDGTRFDIWLKVKDETLKNDFMKWLRVVESAGFGKRKSAGMGKFRVIGDPVPAENQLKSATGANAFITLSCMVPATVDPTEGFYQYRVKRGKLGGWFALGGDVWKKPLIMLQPGSVFRSGGQIREYYGCNVTGVHSRNPAIVQYGFALPLGIRLPENL